MSSSRKHKYDTGMFKGAPVSAFAKAKSLRKNMTRAEKHLWKHLKSKKFLGYKFRRQHPLHLFIVDFYCHKLGLIIEVDGGYHNQTLQQKMDEQRTLLLKFQSLTLLRFSNEQVLLSTETVLQQIEQKINEVRNKKNP